MKSYLMLIILTINFEATFSQSNPLKKLPIDGSRWYQLNSTFRSLFNLFDGNKDSKVPNAFGMPLTRHESYYPLLNGEQMQIDSIRLYDLEAVFTANPLRIYAITSTWERKLIATFTGERYKMWVGPYPDRPFVFRLDTAVADIRYLALDVYGNDYPGEIEFYGSHTLSSTPAGAQPPRQPLKSMMGINGFPWSPIEAQNSALISETKLKAAKSFRGFRMYLDWNKMEPVEGRYYFSPMQGGWPLDTIYSRFKQEGIEVLATILNLPDYIINTYPDSLKATDNNPVRYGADLSSPMSYVQQAKLAFQFAARYGSNKNLDPALVSVYTVPQWYGQRINEKKIGLNLIQFIECGNEVDKPWKGRKGYMTAREYAANLSAFYDGHKNTMGPGVGAKNADSTIQVVMSGVAYPTTDYLRGIIDWCKEFRGYKEDGSVDLCFDVINYHYYSSNRGIYQTTDGNRGVAPERSIADSIARSFVAISAQFAANRPVWITEHGYDVNQNSTMRAIPIGEKSVLHTQADWTLRTALVYARAGLQKSFAYEMFDFDVNNGGKYASMGIINKSDFTRKPAADFLFQTIAQFGEYTYRENISSEPYVDRYEAEGKIMYALVVGDEVGRTIPYNLQLTGADSAIVYFPTIGSDSMRTEKMLVNKGYLNIIVTETPCFVVPIQSKSNPQDSTITKQITTNSLEVPAQNINMMDPNLSKIGLQVRMTPNPVRENLYIENKERTPLKAILWTISGQKVQEFNLKVHLNNINMSLLASGTYIIQAIEPQTNTMSTHIIQKQ